MNILAHSRKPKRPDATRPQHSSVDAELEPNSFVTRDGTYIEPENRLAMIAEAAYFRAERRGFDPGHEVSDWLEAEAAVDAAIKRGDSPDV